MDFLTPCARTDPAAWFSEQRQTLSCSNEVACSRASHKAPKGMGSDPFLVRSLPSSDRLRSGASFKALANSAHVRGLRVPRYWPIE